MRIYRSNRNKFISGLCGGIGEYFNIDPTIIRLAYALFFLINFPLALFLYIVGTIIIPIDSGVINYEDYDTSSSRGRYYKKNNSNIGLIIGLILVTLGLFLILELLVPNFKSFISKGLNFWPILLILFGIYIIFNNQEK